MESDYKIGDKVFTIAGRRWLNFGGPFTFFHTERMVEKVIERCARCGQEWDDWYDFDCIYKTKEDAQAECDRRNKGVRDGK